MPAILAFLTSKAGIVGMIAVGLLLLFGVQELRLDHAKADLVNAKASLVNARALLKTSEDRRAVEYSLSVKDVGDAETACSARVAAATKSSSAIHQIVSKPSASDPKSHCPVRQLVSAGELRNALQP